LGVKARKYKCRRPDPRVEVGWSRGASNPWGRSVKRIAAASLWSPTKSLLRGVLMANCGDWERRARQKRAKASVCGEGIGYMHPQGSPA
jgi:hypothetical protein